MAWLGRVALLFGSLLVCVPALGACSSDDDTDPPQCTVAAAFDLTVRAVSGPLPADTLLEVKYTGGTETYDLDTPQKQEVVLCDELSADGGDAGQEVAVLHCKLWTQGAATVTVTATGYPSINAKELEAKAKGTCIQTVPVELVLGDADAGT